jgi:hypothetical protein
LTNQVKDLTNELNNVSINLGNSNHQIQGNYDSLNSRIETLSDLTEQIEKNVNGQFMGVNSILSKIKNCNYELIYDRSHSRDKLFESLDEVQNRLILVCPWVSSSAIDSNFQNKIQQVLSNNKALKIYIGCGNKRDIDNLTQKNGQQNLLDMLISQHSSWKYNGIPILREIQEKYKDQIHLKVLGTHEKFLVCDNSWALITSHNFLTSGASQTEREVGLLTDDKNIINSLIKRF